MKFFQFQLATFATLSWTSLVHASCGETAARVCFDGSNGSTPQKVSTDDVAYVAAYLRNIGKTNSGQNALWSMPANVDCQEWGLPIDDGGSVLPLAKHIGHRYNSSVLYTDIADAIDGGDNATPAQRSQALLGACGTNGGMVGVSTDPSNPAYNTQDYIKSGAKPTGILVKIVHNPNA